VRSEFCSVKVSRLMYLSGMPAKDGGPAVLSGAGGSAMFKCAQGRRHMKTDPT
jgi:hypothetical protein